MRRRQGSAIASSRALWDRTARLRVSGVPAGAASVFAGLLAGETTLIIGAMLAR
jgi:hypothetical protein